jgi:hypothetical protein
VLIPAPYYPAFDNDLQARQAALALYSTCSRWQLMLKACLRPCRGCIAAGGVAAGGGAALVWGPIALTPLTIQALAVSLTCLIPLCPLLQAKCGVQPLPFFLTEGEPGAEGAAAIRAQLDAATVAAAARGVAVRGLLVTNPNNPLGTIYREDSVREMLRWCLDNRMHYIRWGGWW